MQQEAFLPIGTIIRDHYVVEDLLGKGEGDLVYLVRDRWAAQNLFILKERINPDKQARDRFLFEGVVLKQLHHPALQRVYRIFEENAGYRVYMLMQYIAGQDLETMHRQWPNRSLSLSLALSLMTPVIEAVTYLHSQRDPVIHRDIKPSNIIVPRDKRTVLVNFGIDRGSDGAESISTAFLCSPGYGAPEQYRGETNPSTDLYALAATLYTVLTGIVPPDARERVAQLANRGVDPLIRADEVTSAVPATVAEAIHRSLSLNSDERFSSVKEFWSTLRGSSSTPSIKPVVPVIADERPEESKSVPAESPPVVSEAGVEDSEEQEVLASPVGPDVSWQAPVYRPSSEDAEGSKEQSQQETPELPVRAQLIASPTRWHLGLQWKGLEYISIFSYLHKLPSLSGYYDRLRNHISTRQSSKSAALLLLVLLLAIFLSIGTMLWSRTMASHNPGASTSTSRVVHKVTSAPTKAIPTKPTPTTSPKAGNIYTGTIHDLLANTSTNMSLMGMHLRLGNISGYLSVDKGSRGSGPFKGTFNAAQHIQFVVTDGAGHAIFSFEGGVHPDGNIAGSYCSLNSSGQCSGDYGLWSASPATALRRHSFLLAI